MRCCTSTRHYLGPVRSLDFMRQCEFTEGFLRREWSISKAKISKTRTWLWDKESVKEKKIKGASESKWLNACPTTGRPKDKHKLALGKRDSLFLRGKGKKKTDGYSDLIPRKESKLKELSQWSLSPPWSRWVSHVSMVKQEKSVILRTGPWEKEGCCVVKNSTLPKRRSRLCPWLTMI